MKRNILLIVILTMVITLPVSCGDRNEPIQEDVSGEVAEEIHVEIEPDPVPEPPPNPTIQGVMGANHILVAYTGSGVSGVLRDKADASALAGNVRNSIISGDVTFEDAAKRYSDCSTAESGGVLPNFTEGAMVPTFEDAVLNLELQEISQVVETQFGFHIIERTK